MKKITILTLCLSLFLVGIMSAQETVWVSAAPSGAANGTSEADAYGSLALALFDINSAGDVLKVVGTVAAGNQNLSNTSLTTVNKNFQYTIEGVGAGATLTGVTGTTRMFTINGASVGQNVTFKNIIFSGQNSSIGPGGAVLFSNQAGVTINFENCRFVGNTMTSTTAAAGGALVISVSTLTITDCLFKENTAVRDGGAISIGNAANVTMTGCTFYKNSTTSTTAAQGGGALYVTGLTAVVTINHCTFFQNNIGLTNQDYGTIRSDNGNTTITNSLFYNNKVLSITPPALGGPSDWGSSPNGTQTFSYSLGQWITSNIDVVTNSVSFVKGGLDPLAAANLASSNLTYDDALGKVTYIAPTVAGENSPIDFGSDGFDAGAWDSGLTLSVKDNEFAAKFSVSYHATTKNLKVLRSNDDSVSLEIYNLMGAKVLSRANANKEENINASSLQSGVYILVVKGSGNKSFSQKFVIN
jgi:hypothetical protein